MTFAEPRMLWVTLALLLALIAFLWRACRRKQQLVTQFIQARLLSSLTVGLSTARQKLRLALIVAAVASLMFALARPQWGMAWEEARQRGLDIVVALDTSRSMLAADIAPDRLTRAKLAALDLLRQARTDRMGLVAFAGTAFLQCPLTLDEDAFRQSVNALDVGIIPEGGTALEEAVTTARAAFHAEGDNHKVIILFTDGEDHESGAIEAAKEAAKEGLRIFTVGIGTAQGELLRQVGENGKSDFIRDEDGNVVKSRLNETLLQEIATASRGFYLPLRGANTMDVLYERGLAPLPKAQISAKFIQRFHERFQWPLGLGIMLLLIEMLLPDRRRASVAQAKARTQRLPAGTSVAALLLVL
ncbi:MAG: VWA domain-containing protein, partial [Pedosphaera parvula]|nr:VWA domain-containing protein [Pedosphaera parvula]